VNSSAKTTWLKRMQAIASMSDIILKNCLYKNMILQD